MENGLLHAETKNIAFKKKSFTPSQYNSGPAKRGNDGNEYSDFQTRKGNTAWWAVDLGTGGARVTGYASSTAETVVSQNTTILLTLRTCNAIIITYD